MSCSKVYEHHCEEETIWSVIEVSSCVWLVVENAALKFTGKKQDYGKKEMLSSLVVSSSSMTSIFIV